MIFSPDKEFAVSMDRTDPLSRMRDRFIIPRHNGDDQTYLLGNSLGLQPRSTAMHVDRVLTQWARFGVEGFFRGDEPWMDLHDSLTGPLSTIVGASPAEVTVMNQLTVNLHLMLVSFYRPQGRRIRIVCEQKAFPSDQYMLETYIKHLGMDPGEVLLEITPREGEQLIRLEDIIEIIEERHKEIALVFFGGVNYYTGQVFDMKAITAIARKYGIPVGFDLAHATGNVPLSLHDWDVDFACWCSYKYLNSGPGAVGGVFIHERHHHDPEIPRLAGWWGYHKATRFLMEKGFKPILSAEGWQLSTPSIILYACHLASLEVFAEAGWEQILARQEKMKNYLWFLLEQLNLGDEKFFEVLTPEHDRGCQVSLFMPKNGKSVYDNLMGQGIIVDWREPDVIRLAPVPLYNTFADIWRFFHAIKTMQ